MCNYSVRIPKYPTNANVPMKAMTERIAESQRENIDRIIEATNAPSIGASIRLLIAEDASAVAEGLRSPADYLPTTEQKLYTIGLKMSDSDRDALARLRTFYGAPSISDTVCHLLNQIIGELEKVGA